MKKFILLLTLIYFSFCTMDECDEATDQEKCNSISIGQKGLYCFKADIENEDGEDEEYKNHCMTFPTNADNQKIYLKFVVAG